MRFAQTSQISHDLQTHLPFLSGFHSTPSLEEAPLYRELKPRIVKLLNSYELANGAPPVPSEPYYRAVSWNIERGIRFEEIIHFLKNHPVLSGADILLLTEVDLGMARSGNRNVAREIAERLGRNYFFAPSYLNLAKGCGIEHESQGENEIGIHGNAILSRYPIRDPRIVPLPNSHDKMRGREKRLGSQRSLVATIEFPGNPLRSACVHLDMRSTQQHRKAQMERVLDALPENWGPTLVGGDWNTSTYNSHSTASAIIGFWLRVFMGVDRVMRNHYPHPDRLFERGLFRMLEANGLDYKGCNEPGATTNHYSVEDIKQSKNLREWIPNWCFKFIEWSLRNHGGRCSFKLGWFAQRKLKILKGGEISSDRKGESLPPRVIGNLTHNGRPASDHDAIVVDFSS